MKKQQIELEEYLEAKRIVSDYEEDYTSTIVRHEYLKNIVYLIFTKRELNISIGFIKSKNNNGMNKDDWNYLTDLYKPILSPAEKRINEQLHDDEQVRIGIPEQLIRVFVFTIEGVAYDLNEDLLVSIEAQQILEKINKQLKGLVGDIAQFH